MISANYMSVYLARHNNNLNPEAPVAEAELHDLSDQIPLHSVINIQDDIMEAVCVSDMASLVRV